MRRLCRSIILQKNLFEFPVYCQPHLEQYLPEKCHIPIYDGQEQAQRECQGIVKFSREKQFSDKTFYRSTQCDTCQKEHFYFYCQCNSLIRQSLQPFKYGNQIKCPNEK